MPPRILIVEDEYLVALVSEDALTDAGYLIVGVASTAQQAVQLAGTQRPDLVLMDIRLAGPSDGIQAATDILSLYNIPSVFVTGQADPGTRVRGDRAHPMDWLFKPYTPDQIINVTAKALARLGHAASG